MAFPPQPESITKLKIDDEGYRLSDNEENGRTEYYLVGTEPTKRPPKSLSLDDLWEPNEADDNERIDPNEENDCARKHPSAF